MLLEGLNDLLVGAELGVEFARYFTKSAEFLQDYGFSVLYRLVVRENTLIVGEGPMSFTEIDLQLVGPVEEAEQLCQVFRPRPLVHQVFHVEEPLCSKETHVEVLGGAY